MAELRKKILSLALCCTLCAASVLSLGGCASRGVSGDALPGETAPGETLTQPDAPAEPEPEPLACDPLTGLAPIPDLPAGQRPVAIMLDNIASALPQSGVGSASVVYEMVTEGGIPRVMAVFPSAAQVPGKLGPIRSTRDQFLQLAIPEKMMLLHIGCSVYASDMLNAQKYDTVDGIYLGSTVFAFDDVRAATRDNSHCFYTNNDLVAAGIAARGMPVTDADILPLFRFLPYGEAARVPGKEAADLSFSFSKMAGVAFQYNGETARYLKSEYGDPQMDEATGEQLGYTNLMLLACPVGLKKDGLVSDFDLSKGRGYYFSQGGYQPVTWEKGGVADRLTLWDETGSELAVNPGTSYIAFVDERALNSTLLVNGYSLRQPADPAQQPQTESSPG